MIRTLLIVAAAALLVSVVSVLGAVSLVGPEAIAHGAWEFGPKGWGVSWASSAEPREQDKEGVRTFA